jgi:RHS repeat-associated protein
MQCIVPGAPLQETVYLGNLPVVVMKPGASGPTVYNVYADHLQAPRVLTRASDNQIVWRWDHSDPFGLAQPDENPGGLGTFTYNLRFPGQVFDKETNSHYNYFRDYDPQTGRYVQSDPIGLDGGINTYAYVAGNPISNVDPKGLQLVLRLPRPSAPAGGGGMSPAPGADPVLPGIQHFWPKVIRDAAEAVIQACTPDEDRACSPPAGTQCYAGPDTTHSHAGLNPHYHIFQMFKFGGKCQWKYLGGKVGKGVLAVPPDGMSPCSSYPGFQGRG